MNEYVINLGFNHKSLILEYITLPRHTAKNIAPEDELSFNLTM